MYNKHLTGAWKESSVRGDRSPYDCWVENLFIEPLLSWAPDFEHQRSSAWLQGAALQQDDSEPPCASYTTSLSRVSSFKPGTFLSFW